jgi:hypothetical protein
MSWYWCLEHRDVETEDGCRSATRLGPYESPEAARDWRNRAESREDRWEEDDARWEGRRPRYRPR